MWNFDWDRYWWLIIILAVLTGPFVQALFAPWRQYLRYRRQKDAIDALKVYAQQNRDPPPEVLDALRGRWIWRAGRTARTVAENVAGGVASGVAAGVRGDDKWDRRWDRWERRMDIRIAGEPLRRWNWPIFTGSVTLGFGLAWRYAHANNDTFLIIAIIAGALTVAGVLSAMVATFWRIP